MRLYVNATALLFLSISMVSGAETLDNADVALTGTVPPLTSGVTEDSYEYSSDVLTVSFNATGPRVLEEQWGWVKRKKLSAQFREIEGEQALWIHWPKTLLSKFPSDLLLLPRRVLWFPEGVHDYANPAVMGPQDWQTAVTTPDELMGLLESLQPLISRGLLNEETLVNVAHRRGYALSVVEPMDSSELPGTTLEEHVAELGRRAAGQPAQEAQNILLSYYLAARDSLTALQCLHLLAAIPTSNGQQAVVHDYIARSSSQVTPEAFEELSRYAVHFFSHRHLTRTYVTARRDYFKKHPEEAQKVLKPQVMSFRGELDRIING